MLQAVVVGNVWSTKRIAGLPSGAFLEVEVTGSGERLLAFAEAHPEISASGMA